MIINKRHIVEIIIVSVIAVLIAAFIRTYFFQTFKVSSKSMEPTFLENDSVLVLKENFRRAKIKRYDVVVFRDMTSGRNLIKRVVGVSGDKIEIKDFGLFVNDELISNHSYFFTTEDNVSVLVSKNQYFVLGDNVLQSRDSRHFGAINGRQIIGRVFLIFNPRERLQFFKLKDNKR